MFLMWGGSIGSCLLSSFLLLGTRQCEIFYGYVVDGFHIFFISDVGLCRFSRSSMLLV